MFFYLHDSLRKKMNKVTKLILYAFLPSLAAERLAAQALGRLCNTRFILSETSSKQKPLPLAALGQVA